MEISATLVCEGDERLLSSLRQAFEEQDQKRFRSEVLLESGKLTIKVEAKDPTALRASLNTYLRILQAVDEVV